MQRFSLPLLSVTLAVSALLTGCGLGINSSSSSSQGVTTAAAKISGKVFGGQQPVSGSTIQLYTVGTTASGSASTALLTATVTSGSQGEFSISGLYNCTSATQVYITATGGNAGSGVNTSLSMMSALGSCATLLANASTTFIQINELTTVAAIYSLAPFMVDVTHIGAAGSNPTGLVNAFSTAATLVNTGTGQIANSAAGLTLPVARLDTIADILAACINTAGASSSQCTTLFNATGAADTLSAAYVIAKNPAAGAITALYSLASGTPPFNPTLSARPNDFTLAINYTGAELLAPYGLAIDAAGNAWVTNQAGRSVTKLPALNPALATTTYNGGGLLAPRGISIDRTGNIWIANSGANSVVELSSAGAVLSGSGYTAGGISSPIAIANDSAGNAWVANFNSSSLTELGSTGTPSAASPIATSLSLPTAIAIDATGTVAVANAGTGTACLFSSAGVLQSCPTDNTLFGATGIAISKTGALTLSGSTTGSAVTGAFTLGTSAGSVNTASPVTGGGLVLPVAVAYDGAGTAWFANSASISAFSGATAISPSTGFGSLSAPQSIAVDASGNLWSANSGDNSVSVFIGLTAPVVTPLAATVGP